MQIIEVLGASGFKDIKKTVGEENRLIIFDDLEERVYDIFHSAERLARNRRVNQKRMEREGDGGGWRYRQLQNLVKPTELPHHFYDVDLKPSCYQIFDRDHVWPASLIASAGRMASGDPKTFLLSGAAERGNLGDGFDAIRVRFPEDPDRLPEERIDGVATSLQLRSDFKLKAPFIGAGMSVGSIGPGTWRARVLATRTLGTQMDTGEGGYPTCFILDAKWDPLDFNDAQVAFLGRFMEERILIQVERVIQKLKQISGSPEGSPTGSPMGLPMGLMKSLGKYPASMLIQYVPIVTPDDQPYVSTQLKTGLFGVTKETIRRARRVVIAYSQGAKQGV
ncbi:MAG: glutamate synthase-related protein, partial [Deltaproteobacteria bacterium]|nr:glutamate synthase-related protein [Deltaproteobacteria bacterium]